MDQILPNLLSFPPHPPPSPPLSDSAYDTGIKDQIAFVKRNLKQLQQKTSSGEQLINVINPALNTIPYAFALLGLIESRQKNADVSFIWGKLDHFLRNFDPRQVRYIGNEFTKITDFVAQLARSNRSLGAAVPLLSRALLRLDPEGTVLTTTHLLLVNLVLESRNFNLVTAVISRPVLYFPGKISTSKIQYVCNLALPNHAYITATTGLTKSVKPSEVLEYLIYAGSIFIALRQWEKAVEVLEDAICYPCKENAISKIMVEAYKKWILASLLWKGKVGKLPVSLSPFALKSLHALAKSYETIAEQFSTATAVRFHQEAVAGQNIWKGDRNTSLMQAVLSAYQKHQIRALANVYTAVSIAEVTKKTSSADNVKRFSTDADTERLVRQMIAEGTLNGSVRSDPGGAAILIFEPVQALSEAEMAQKLGAAVRSIQAVTKDVKQTDHRLTEDKEYLKWANKQRRAGNKGPVNTLHAPGEEMDLTWTGPDVLEDEDLMSA